MKNERHYPDLVVFGRLVWEGRAYLPHAGLLLVISLLATPIALLAPVPLKVAVDNVIGHEPLPEWLAAVLPEGIEASTTSLTVAVAVTLVGITLVGELRTLVESVFGAYAGEKLLLRFRSKLFRQGQRLSLAYHDTVGTADSAYRIQYDSWAIRTVILSGITPLITSLVTLCAMLFVIMQLDRALGLIALAVAPVMFALTWMSRRRLRSGWRNAKAVESSSLSVIQETLTSLRVVKAFGREEHEENRFASRARESMNILVRLTFLEGWIGLALSIVTSIGTGLVLFVGILHVEDGVLTLGSLLLVMGYLTQLYTPLRTIARQIGSLQSALASGERVLSLLDEAPDVPESARAVPLARASGSLEFRGVSFGYGDEPDVLRDVSFAVPAGARVGIAGMTGAGKTTLVSLICRFYDPRSGQILLDGVDIRDFRVSDIRDQYGIVLQEPVLFSATIAENIAYARPEAGHKEIAAAAKAANAHEFIERLPDGYATVVGERGMRLSGGERQRISLARAFLKDAPILILDEPTSSVDVETEAGIIDAMERLMTGRTSFMIAHRLTTLEGCDIRLKVAGGTVTVERGYPAERSGPSWVAGSPSGLSAADRPVEAHPALLAWGRVSPAVTVESIETLRNGRTAVYRLHGVGPDRHSVIAKRRPRSDGAERMFYSHLRDRLGVGTPRLLGIVDDDGDGCSWIFLEDLGEGHYDASRPAHSRAAGRWLAALHRESVPLAGSIPLGDRSPSSYRSSIGSIRETLARNADNQRLSNGDRLVIDYAAGLAAACEDGWARIEGLCASMPSVLVHGNLTVENVRVLRGEAGERLVALDWGKAGWGPPAVDLAQRACGGLSPSLETYVAEMAPAWPALTIEVAAQAADVGTVFRALDMLARAADGLATAWVEGPMSEIVKAADALSRVDHLVDGSRDRTLAGDGAR